MSLRDAELASIVQHANAKVIPPGATSLATPEAVGIIRNAFERVEATRGLKKCRKRAYNAIAAAEEGTVSGTAVMNSAGMIAAQRQLRLEEEERREKSKRLKAAAAEKKVARDAIIEDRKKRSEALVAKFPNVPKEKLNSWGRSLGRYYSGNRDIEWATALIQKKLKNE
jgi:hypothetical protein